MEESDGSAAPSINSLPHRGSSDWTSNSTPTLPSNNFPPLPPDSSPPPLPPQELSESDDDLDAVPCKRPHVDKDCSDADSQDDQVQANFKSEEYDIVDDIGGSDDEGGMDWSDNDDIALDDIDAMLESGLERCPKDDFNSPIIRQKIVLKERGHDHFDILPAGWISVTHNSGMPVYLHKETRVCSLSRPYFLGNGSVRKHAVPLSAIPCLHYRREKDREESGATKENGQQAASGEELPADDSEEKTSPGGGPVIEKSKESMKLEGADVKVKSVEQYNQEMLLDWEALKSYCEAIFDFQVITVKKYKTWKDKRKHLKQMQKLSRPSLPSDTKLIMCPILVNRPDAKPNRKHEFTINPSGKSNVSILHEYVQNAMKLQPKYVFKELENSHTPYSATVVINDQDYATGYANSKRNAKNEAAKLTLQVLVPEVAKELDGAKGQIQDDVSFFDEVRVEDQRVTELCQKAGKQVPFQILSECLKRNFGLGDTSYNMEMKTLKPQKNEFSLVVGKHEAVVTCKNKREGKQLAAQAILQKLHPHIHTWGSLLRLYGTDWKGLKEKEEQASVTLMHSKLSKRNPNNEILMKLKEEMLKLRDSKNAMLSKGKLTMERLKTGSSVPAVDL